MAWALQFDGVNDYVTLDTARSFTTTEEYSISIDFKIELGTSNDIHTLILGDGTNYLYYRVSTNSFFLKAGGSNFSTVVPSADVLGNSGTITIRQYSDGGKTFEYTGVSESTPSAALRTFYMSGFGGGNNWKLDGRIEKVTFYSDVTLATVVSEWDATASSHAAGAPILTDTVAGNNATGVNMPTDGSAWIDLGGGGLVISPTGISSGEIFGAVVLISDQGVSPVGISSSETFGTVILQAGGVTIITDSIVSGEALGNPELSYPQVVVVSGVGSEEVFGIAMIQDGVEMVIPIGDRVTYQALQVYLMGTGQFVSIQNNDIIVEWLKFEGGTSGSFNELFYEYWGAKGFTGGFSDRRRRWLDS